jgi:hypothetical protein
MVENKDLREEQDRGGSDPKEVFDYAYFRTKFNITTEEVITAIREAKTNSPLELEEYIANKYNLPEDKPDIGKGNIPL